MSIWAYAIHWAMFKVHFESTAWCIVTHKLSCSTEVKTCLRKVDHDGGPEHEMRTVTRYLEIHCIWFHVPLKKKIVVIRGHLWPGMRPALPALPAECAHSRLNSSKLCNPSGRLWPKHESRIGIWWYNMIQHGHTIHGTLTYMIWVARSIRTQWTSMDMIRLDENFSWTL